MQLLALKAPVLETLQRVAGALFKTLRQLCPQVTVEVDWTQNQVPVYLLQLPPLLCQPNKKKTQPGSELFKL